MRAAALRRRPSSIQAGIDSGSAPALRHSRADCRAIGSFSSPSDVPSRIPATSASRSPRPVRELAQLGHRRGFLLPGQLAPPGVMPGGASELGDEDAVTISALTAVNHVPSVAGLYGKYAPDCQDTGAGHPLGRAATVRRPAPNGSRAT